MIAVHDGRVVKDVFRIERLGIVKAVIFNLRRPKLQDPRVRQALALAYNFDDVNRNVFHNMLSRPASYFPQTDFEAKGPLSADESALLRTLPAAPDAEVLSAIGKPQPETSARTHLFNALGLLREAGFRLRDGRLLDARGEQLTLEFVLDDVSMERVASAYADQLAKLGIAALIRVVDDVQYQNRLRTFDFDLVVHGWVQGHAPGSEQREYWSSDSAPRRGTNNLGGLTSPLVDVLVDRLILASSRADKIAAGRLLDRVLRQTVLGIPIMSEDKEFVARWDRFGRPASMPQYGAAAFPGIWWWDKSRAEKTGGRNR
jgi:microcin C transport system substrate-binding protein